MINGSDIYKKRYLITLVLLSLIYGVVFLSLNILKYKSFFSYECEDDARENQVVYNIAASLNPHQTIVISNYFSDHFTPIYFLIALFYRIFPHIYTWYFVMSFSYGFCSLIVYLLANDILKHKGVAFVVSLSYLLYPALHYVNLGALDGNCFSLPLLFITLYFLYKQKFILYAVFVILSCMCKEDIPVIIFLLGMYQLIRKYPKKWWLSTILFSGAYFIMAVYISNNFLRVQGFSSDIVNNNFHYLDFITFKGILLFIFFNPKEAFLFIFTLSHLRVFLMTLSTLFFLPVFSLEMYIPMIMFGEILINKGFDNVDSYYLAPIIPFFFIALIFTLRRVKSNIRFKNLLPYLVTAILITCCLNNFGRNIIGLIPVDGEVEIHDHRFLNVRNIFDKRFYIMDEEDKAAWKLLSIIPKNASVTASGDLLPALSSRKVLYEFGLNHPKAIRNEYSYIEYPNYSVDYVLIHKKYMVNGVGGHYAFLENEYLENEIRQLVDRHHFSIIEEYGSFILLGSSKDF
ncbi:MAG: hypothetical protein DRP78_01975 [Candidatus Omnitrophota bacterium]|nr:MAG: hypothetical protein DRP78_01975 [Candidatus Omnitrophota bacterium]